MEKLIQLQQEEFQRAEEKLKGVSDDDYQDWQASPITQALVHLLEHNILTLTLAWREGSLYKQTLPTYGEEGKILIPGDPDAEKRAIAQVGCFELLLDYMTDFPEWIETLKEETEDDESHGASRAGETGTD